MAVKIIRVNSKTPEIPKQITCVCGAVLEYIKEDVTEEKYFHKEMCTPIINKWINCPNCKDIVYTYKSQGLLL